MDIMSLKIILLKLLPHLPGANLLVNYQRKVFLIQSPTGSHVGFTIPVTYHFLQTSYNSDIMEIWVPFY